ncbi:caspase-like isoform X2 [Ornithodoros turicata]
MKRQFELLGLDTTLAYGDVTKTSLLEEMEKGKRSIKQTDSLFAMCFMSHGEKGSIITSDLEKIKLQYILDEFNSSNCPALKNKPRLCMFQLCQDEPNAKEDMDEDEQDNEEMHNACWDYTIDLRADFLLVFATPAGFKAWRHCDGSYFVDAFKEALEEHKGEEIDMKKLFTTVGSRVAEKNIEVKRRDAGKEKPEDSTKFVKQMPCIVSSLTKDLILRLQ